MSAETNDDPLPERGAAFEPSDEVAFFPAEISVPDDPGWFRWKYVVIDDVNERAHTFGGHFLSTPAERFTQDMNNIVRRTPHYHRWRAAMEHAIARGSPDGDPQLIDLWVRVLAEHPIHGGSEFPHRAVAARRSPEPRDIAQR